MKSNLFIITPSGWSYIGGAFIAFIVFFLLGFQVLATIAFGFILVFAYLFRNPEREMLHFEEQGILSPVDGYVSEIVTLDSDSEYGYRVDIVSEYRHLSILRAPFNCTLKSIGLQNGVRVAKESSLFELLSENRVLVFEMSEGAFVKVEHRLTRSFAPFFLELSEGQKLYQGSRYGVMQSGATSIYLPSTFRIEIHPLEELKASESLIGFLS